VPPRQPSPSPASPSPRGYRHGARAVLPLAIAVGTFGVAYGVLARQAGMGRFAPVIMSLTTFAGSAQFAAASVLGAGGSAAAAIAAAALLNARYGPIGVTVAPWLHGGGVSRFLHAQLIVDESWALAAEGDGRWNRRILVAAGLGIYIAWVAGTIAGVTFGDALGDPERLGLDAAFPALFLALLWPQLRGRRSNRAAALGATIALALTPITPPGVPIVVAAGACLLGLRDGRGLA
jgi:4-azaleucine resistance transporter AzlC